MDGCGMIIIYGIKEQLNPIKARLSDTLHACMQEVLGMPEDKRAHRFIPMDKDDFITPVAAVMLIPSLKLI